MSDSAVRALETIEFLLDAPRSLTDITDRLEVHKSTALRLLQLLSSEGYVRRLDDGKYTTGYTMLSLAHRVVDGMELGAVARPQLASLSERFGHTVHLAKLDKKSIVYISKLEGPGALKMHSRVGDFVELHTSAVSKAILAHLPQGLQEELLEQITYRRYTPATITDPISLRRELAATRERGWAEDDGERESFLGCVSAPIFDARGFPVAAISLTALRSLVSKHELRDLVPAVQQAALSVSRELGYSGPAQPELKEG